MAMKKLILFVLLLAFAAAALPLVAQEEGSAQLQQEVNRLKAEVEDKQAKIDSLDNELKKYPNIEEQIKSLENELQQKGAAVRQAQVEYEKKRVICDSLKNVINSVEPEYKAQKERNGELETHKRTIAPLVKRQLSQMANGIDQTWLSKTYAETDVAMLREDLALYEAFKDEDKGVANAYAKLKAFSDDVTLYGQGVETVNSRYEAKRVAALVQPLGALATKETHQGRKQEAETVYGQMKDYKNTLRYFQEDIIPEVDEILRKANKKNTKEAWEQVKNYLDTGDGGMIRHYLTKIPWIGTQYNLYIKQLENDPFGKNAARQTIMSIKP